MVELGRSDSLIGKREARGTTPDPEHDTRCEEYVRLRLLTIAAERAALLEARSRGTYSSKALNAAQRRLDIEETRLQALGEHL
ncbi:hypothetical protein MWU77_22190 [Rhodococcus sp. F64268]|uniref:hypothetical protein n=1 Tax=unclassified Rhodococcus (in: high G+C Gram-positive bacteria) TaxID=192944 RepID=UPI00197E9EEF|nr:MULTISPECIES: hypothetical protein [unclassified Rhodococcus (in: high G+C Gram-positive bacteria)]MCK0093490.1 hypothetical protein [Rhodococcus sp. F64268]